LPDLLSFNLTIIIYLQVYHPNILYFSSIKNLLKVTKLNLSAKTPARVYPVKKATVAWCVFSHSGRLAGFIEINFPVPVDALRAYLQGQEPDLAWIVQPAV